MKKDCVLQSYTVRENVHVSWGKHWKTLLGLCTFSLLTKFVAFTANLFSKNTASALSTSEYELLLMYRVGPRHQFGPRNSSTGPGYNIMIR